MKTLDKERINIKSKEASFLSKLYKILEDPSFYNCIRWSSDGLSFIIINQKLFEKKALPKYFAHHKFSSFHRQLNLYNFRKVKNKNGEQKYEHEEFNKWKTIEEIKLIKKKIKNKKEKENKYDNIINTNIKIENKIEENKKIENNIEENKKIDNDIILKFQNLDESSKIDICENIIKKGELSKNENQLLLIYLLDKNKENIETIKMLQNEIKILNDKNSILMGHLKQFGVSYYYLQNKNDKIKSDIQNLNININEEFPQIINKDKERRNDFSYLNNYNRNFIRNYDNIYYNNDYNSNYNSINYNNNYNNNYVINSNNIYDNNSNSLKNNQISTSNNTNNGINYYYNYKV